MLRLFAQDNSLIVLPFRFRSIFTRVTRGLAIVLLAAGPASFLLLEDVGGIVWGVTVVAGLAVACTNYHEWWPDLLQNGRPVILCLGILLVYLALPVLSYFLIDNSDFAKSRVTRQFLLLGIPFALLLLWRLNLRLRTVLSIIALNASAFGIYAFWYVRFFSWRAEGIVHAVHFGNLSLFLALASLALLPVTHHFGWRLLAVVGLVLGGAASILAGARGGWIAAPVLFVVTLIMVTRVFKLRRHMILWLIGLAVLFFSSLWNIEIVRSRLEGIQNNLVQLSQSNWQNSIGERILMWEQAWLEIREAPIKGTGFSGYRARIQAAVESGALPEEMLDYATEPHNEYLYQWATRGAFGLTVFLLCLGGAGWYFFRLLLRGDSTQMAIAQVGLSLVVIISIGGLTITIVDQRAVIRFLGWILALLLYCVWLSRKENQAGRAPAAGGTHGTM